MKDGTKTATLAIRCAHSHSQFNEHSPALFLTSSFVFASAAEAAAVFAEEKEAFSYSRFANPTVAMFEQRLAELEGGVRATATASGMAAIMTLFLAKLKAGDHVICARNCFGSTLNLLTQTLAKFAITTTLVNLEDLDAWQDAICENTKMLFIETPANPLLNIGDMAALAELARRHNALFVVDNCLATPCLQKPFDFGAHFVVHSATKYIDGQGRALGGAIVCNDAREGDIIYRLMRGAGTTMGAFEGWLFLKSLETLPLRMKAHSDNALHVAKWLQQQTAVKHVYYPGLQDHPQHELATKQMPNGYGGILSFSVHGGKDAAWRVIDNCNLFSISGNLGDTRTIITHPDSTTHFRVAASEKKRIALDDDIIRLSVGLENVTDICNSLASALRGEKMA